VKYFSSSIADKRLSDFQKYDASLKKYDDRLELVLGLLNDEEGNLHKFMTTYFAEYYDFSPAQTGYTAEQDAVCKTIEGLGTYLLNAKDIVTNRKVKYRFWKSEREFKQYKESTNVNISTLEAGMEEGTEVIDMFFSHDDKNYKKDTNQRLFAKDLKEIVEIKTLQDGIDTIKTEHFIKQTEKYIDSVIPSIEDEKDLAKLKSIRRNVENYVNKWASTMSDNQILIKEAIKRPIRFKNVLKDEGASNKLEDFDFMEEKEVKALIQSLSQGNLMEDFGILVYDLNCLIDKSNLSKREQEVVNLYREGLRQFELADELDISKQSIKKMEERIAKKVVKTYEKQIEQQRERIRNNLKIVRG